MSKIRLLAGAKQSGETSKAIQACNDYLRLGPGRSLSNLIGQYIDINEREETLTVPTLSQGTLGNWSTKYGWQQRAEQYDARIEEKKTQRAEEIMNTGLALVHNRTEKLKNLFDLLEDQLFEKDPVTGVLHNLWLKDYKSLGQGDSVEIERFNAPLIRELRATLDDIAAEVGERIKQVQSRNLNVDLDSFTNEQLARLAAGEDITSVLAQRGDREAS